MNAATIGNTRTVETMQKQRQRDRTISVRDTEAWVKERKLNFTVQHCRQCARLVVLSRREMVLVVRYTVNSYNAYSYRSLELLSFTSSS